jgi:hypothetical protein
MEVDHLVFHLELEGQRKIHQLLSFLHSDEHLARLLGTKQFSTNVLILVVIKIIRNNSKSLEHDLNQQLLPGLPWPARGHHRPVESSDTSSSPASSSDDRSLAALSSPVELRHILSKPLDELELLLRSQATRVSESSHNGRLEDVNRRAFLTDSGNSRQGCLSWTSEFSLRESRSSDDELQNDERGFANSLEGHLRTIWAPICSKAVTCCSFSEVKN